MTTRETDHEITIRDLYPHLDEEQTQEAEENFKRYTELELRVYERILASPEGYARFKALTTAHKNSTMTGERSIPP